MPNFQFIFQDPKTDAEIGVSLTEMDVWEAWKKVLEKGFVPLQLELVSITMEKDKNGLNEVVKVGKKMRELQKSDWLRNKYPGSHEMQQQEKKFDEMLLDFGE